MDESGEDPWPHFNDHVTNMHQDNHWALSGRGELWAFALPPPGIEEPNLHPRGALTRLAPVVVPELHFYTHQMELAAGEGMNSLHAFLQMICVTLPQRFFGTVRHRAT